MIAETPLQLDTIIVRNSELLDSEIDGEIVMMDIESGKYFGMNKIGSKIWKMIENPIKIETVCKHLLSVCKIDKATCENEVLSYLNHLHTEKLIQIK